jgi:hypothetical protein
VDVDAQVQVVVVGFGEGGVLVEALLVELWGRDVSGGFS